MIICPHCKKEINRANKILELLKEKERSAGELADILSIRPSSISEYLKKLENNGNIIIERYGKGKKINVKAIIK